MSEENRSDTKSYDYGLTSGQPSTASDYLYGQEYCVHRLPCGICKLLNTQCPKQPFTVTPTWTCTPTTVNQTMGENT